VSRFLPTSRRLVQFSEGKFAPEGATIVYIDGAFDVFHVGHVAILEVRLSIYFRLQCILIDPFIGCCLNWRSRHAKEQQTGKVLPVSHLMPGNNGGLLRTPRPAAFA
jgi:hypothetical protein